MSTLGQTGPNGHAHPGLTFPQVNGLRRGFPPPQPPSERSKKAHAAAVQQQHTPQHTPQHQQHPQQQQPPPQQAQQPQPHQQPQHPSPYPPHQQYTPQQPPQGTYPQHLFSSATPSPVQNVANAHHVPNGTHRQNPSPAQMASAVQAARHQQRGPARQMQQQPTPSMAYLQQTMNQQLPQQVQPVQNGNQQQPQQVQQVQQIPPVQQVQQVQPVRHVQQVPQVQQPNDQNLMSHPPPQQPQQVQQVQQAQPQSIQSQPTPPQPQIQHPPPPAPSQAEPTAQDQLIHPDDDMEIDSADGDESHLEPKLLEGKPYVPRSAMGPMMSPPPEGGSFASLDAVHKHVIAYCTSVGYAVVIGRSKKTVPGLKKVLFVCDRAGKPPTRVSPEQRKRKTSSRKCNCQFGFFAIEQRTQWTIRYRPDQAHLEHNHGPSESPLLHPAARKLDSKMVAAVKQLKESGIGVSQTLEILQQENPHVPLLPRDIYNARAAINRNPQKVETGLAEARPAIYSKPPPSPEERIRADLRREIQKARDDLKRVQEESKKEIEDLKEKLREKDKIIEKFEMFIDICNERVMVQRQRLADGGDPAASSNNSS